MAEGRPLGLGGVDVELARSSLGRSWPSTPTCPSSPALLLLARAWCRMTSSRPRPPLFTAVPSSTPVERPRSHRALHVQNVLAVLQLSVLRQDYGRARRAWALLARTREIPWESLYRFESALRRGDGGELDLDGGRTRPGAVNRQDWLEDLRRESPREVSQQKELVCCMYES